LLDLLALLIAVPAALEVYERTELAGAPLPTLPPPSVLFAAFALAVAAWSVTASAIQLYAAPTRTHELVRLVRTVLTVGVSCAAVGFLTAEAPITRYLVALYFAFTLALALVLRLGAEVVSHARHAAHGASRRYAVVGTGGMAREVVEGVTAHPEWGLAFAGFIRTDGTAVGTRGPFLGPIHELGRILQREIIDIVVFAVPRERLAEVERAVHLCEEHGVEVRISLDVLRFGPGRMTVTDMDGVPMLTFSRAPTDALALAIKRTFDVVVSGLVLLLLSPVLAGIALAIRLDSRGPIFFRQRRAGQNGRTFDMLKFRSMHEDAEERLEALRAQNEMTGPVFKMANDPRVTRIGRLLRKTSLDEFPQFWNVLKGEMSIVGPRPPIPAEVRQYKLWQRRRLSMKPGITCIWQVSGRNNIDFDHWMELDLQYIDEWSLWGDIRICFQTIPAVLTTRGAR
jgi:exopolysaccharide biosynthesis polyprenyl glycosylphosphotransferase